MLKNKKLNKMGSMKKLVYLLAIMVALVAFSSCNKNEDLLVSQSETSLQESSGEDVTLRSGASIDKGSPLLDESLPFHNKRYPRLSIPAGGSRYVEFLVSDFPVYRIRVRHSTQNGVVQMRRYRAGWWDAKLLASHPVYQGTTAVETNSNGPQGNSSHGDYVLVVFKNTSNRDINDFVFNWALDFND